YVVVLSEAMLRLASHLARADDGDRVDAYASFVARSQLPGRRLVPPPPGYFALPGPPHAVRLGETLSFLIARELAHARAGDVVCPNPTATRESQDDVWTADERRKAAEVAATVYPGHQSERDAEATERVLESGATETGARTLLRFFERLESRPGSHVM